VARRDGLPILWPKATHGAPTSPGVLAGKLLPHRTAAECIDWSIPCPSIFERKKPLADATLRRIAKGIMRYVVDAANPFIVGQGGPIYAGKPVSVHQPLGTIPTESHRSIVVPSIVPVTHQGGDRSESVNEPFRTITGAHRGEKALASATLVQVGYGEREGQAPRALNIEKPLGTVVGSSKAALVTAFLNEHANSTGQRVMPADEPLRTICAQVKGGHFSMVSAALVGVGGRAGDSRPRGVDEPTATITSKYDTAVVSALLVDTAHSDISPTGVKRWGEGHKDIELPLGTISSNGNSALATAFLAKNYTGVVGSDLANPIGTVTAQDHHSLVTSNLVKLRGTSNAAATDEPLGTISAQGQHHAEVRAFLVKYYGSDQDPRLEEPMHTVTSKDRFGLVTIQGQDYEIVDIGLRMLAPPELYRAQGFPLDYIIHEIPDPKLLFVDGHQTTEWPLTLPRIPLTKSAQVRMCGNSVCPPLSEALIRANFMHEHEMSMVAA
ncbi:MAG: cytosine methyltransferase, partial [Gammaproteobacteria bacterium]|nr:cytosine methyltransferase [Gammaproteobacteria bacterium]